MMVKKGDWVNGYDEEHDDWCYNEWCYATEEEYIQVMCEAEPDNEECGVVQA